MPIHHVKDIDMYYEQHGHHGDDLILIGGLTADHHVWKTTLRLFSPHFRVLVFDSRGAGRSSAPDTVYSTQMMAEDTVALMDSLDISTAHVVGHSMGGMIAQHIALQHPSRVNKLVISASRAKPSARSSFIFRLKEKLELAGVSPALIAEYMMPYLFDEHFLSSDIQTKGFIQWTLRNPSPQSLIGYQRQLEAVRHHDTLAQLHRIQAPTLIVSGENDILMPAETSRELLEKIPTAHWISLPHCAHMPHVEQPHEFATAVMRFLQNLS